MKRARPERTAVKPVRTTVVLPAREPQAEVKKIFETALHEPSREELDPLSRLLFDANLYLNGYLEALKDSSTDGRQAQSFNRADVKGIGAA